MRRAALDFALLTVPLTVALSAAAAAQGGGALTFDQVERQYSRMSEVHIVKCDHNGDQFFNRTEMACVGGIYHQMYVAD